MRATFFDAGHILDSAITVLEISENGNTKRLAFSGDLGRKKMPLLRSLYFFIVQLVAPIRIILKEPIKKKGKRRVFD